MNRFLLSRSLRHPPPVLALVFPRLRPFCSQPQTDPQPETKPTSLSDPAPKPDPPVPDVSNAGFKRRIEQYLHASDEQALPSIFEAVLARKLAGNHEDTDEELVEEFRFRPRDDITNRELESDFAEMHDTDEDLPDLYNAREYVQHKMAKDGFFNMDDKKWDDMIKEATDQGFLRICSAGTRGFDGWRRMEAILLGSSRRMSVACILSCKRAVFETNRANQRW